MKIFFSLLKAVAFVLAFIFFSANFVSAFSGSIGSVTTTEPYIDGSNQYNFPIKIDNINYKGDNLKFEYSSNSGASWNSFSGNTFKDFTVSEDISKSNVVTLGNEVIEESIIDYSKGDYLRLDMDKETVIYNLTTLKYHTLIKSFKFKSYGNGPHAGVITIYDTNGYYVGESEVGYLRGKYVTNFNFSDSILLEPNSIYSLKFKFTDKGTYGSKSLYYDSSNGQIRKEVLLKGIDYTAYNSNNIRNDYIGIATSNASSGSILKIQTSGYIDNVNNYNIGESVFISDVPGKLSTTNNLNGKMVGIISNNGKLLLDKGNFNDVALNAGINFSELQEGSNTVLFRAIDDQGNISNNGKLNLTKSSKPIISIVNDNLELSDFKSFSASTNIGMLFYSITDKSICDNSLKFEPYKDIVLEDSKYNKHKICFKAVSGQDETYKFSEVIDGIKGFNPIENGDVFFDYKKWKKSTNIKLNDTSLAFLKMMASTSTDSSRVTTSFPSSLIDVNGDGLVDMLYSNYSTSKALTTVDGRTFWANTYYYKYSIMINNGDFSYNPVYRCMVVKSPDLGLTDTYYGNCAE